MPKKKKHDPRTSWLRTPSVQRNIPRHIPRSHSQSPAIKWTIHGSAVAAHILPYHRYNFVLTLIPINLWWHRPPPCNSSADRATWSPHSAGAGAGAGVSLFAYFYFACRRLHGQLIRRPRSSWPDLAAAAACYSYLCIYGLYLYVYMYIANDKFVENCSCGAHSNSISQKHRKAIMKLKWMWPVASCL